MAKKTSRFTIKELAEIRQGLPGTWIKDLAEKHSMVEGTIKNILYGSSVNDDVVLSAYELAKSYESKVQQVKAELSA